MHRWTFAAGCSALLLLLACGPTSQGTGDGGNVGSSDASDASVVPTCEQVQPISVSPSAPPDLLLLVDKSQSMQGSLNDEANKWETMRDALTAVSLEFESSIHMGLSLYPRGAACASGIIDVPIDASSGAMIRTALAEINPTGATPTHLTLRAAKAHFDALTGNSAGRYVLLATDGVPNCGYSAELGRNSSKVSSTSESVAAIQALRADGITTFVVGFDGEAIEDDSALIAMAAAAGTGPYVQANSSVELRAAFLQITGQIGADVCTIRLDAVPEDPSKLDIYLDGVQIPRTPSHQEGWDYEPINNTVTFYGAPCDQLSSGTVVAARVDYGCPGPVID